MVEVTSGDGPRLDQVRRALTPVSPSSRGETRAVTGHDIASEPIDQPKSYERVRRGIERMPKSGTMPNSQASSRELSELSRI